MKRLSVVTSMEEMKSVVENSPLRNPDVRLSRNTTLHNSEGLPTRYTSMCKTVSASPFAHEMGHAMDFWTQGKPERIIQSYFGLQYPSEFIFDRFIDTPMTTRGVTRECVAFAYEWHILELLGFDVPREYCISNAKLITTEITGLLCSDNIKSRRGITRQLHRKAIAIYRNPASTMSDHDTTRLYRTARKHDQETYAMKRIAKHYMAINKEDVIELWHDIIPYLKHHLWDNNHDSTTAS